MCMENLNSNSLYLHTVRVLFTTCQRKSQGSKDSFNKIFFCPGYSERFLVLEKEEKGNKRGSGGGGSGGGRKHFQNGDEK